MKPPTPNNKPGKANNGQTNCPQCGKPVAGREEAGDLAAHLFQANYCSCGQKTKKQGPNAAGFMQKLGAFGASGKVVGGSAAVPSRQSPGEGQSKEGAGASGQDAIEEFCPRCGLTIAKASLPGSMTGYLFQDIRCKCLPEADFSQGAMAGKFWQLKKSDLGTTFARTGMEGKQGSTVSIDLANGAIIGGTYRIISLIGTGGMGEVYLAEHLTLSKQCALKVIPPERVTEIGWRRFQQEARTIAKLDHVNLVKVSDLGIHDGCLPYYAMEFVEGRTLADIIAGVQSLAMDTTIKIFIQVCDGVDHAHRAGIVHRDLKPGNIMVGGTPDRPTVKILDFGLVKLLQHDREKQSMTAAGEVFGSPFYMSPEQCIGEKVDNRSDIYSIGCSLFECLTGRPPFIGHDLPEIISRHLQSDPPSLESVAGVKKFPSSLEVVLAKLLRKNPVERYQNLTELRNDLNKVSRGEAVEPFYVSRSKISGSGAMGEDAAYHVIGADDADRKSAALGTRIVLLGAVIAAISAAVSASIHTPKTMTSTVPVVGAAPVLGTSAVANTAPVANTTSGVTGSAKKVDPLEERPLASYIETSPALRPQMLEDMPELDSDPAVTPKSASDTRPFSTFITESGVTYRVFNFPKDIMIGAIGEHDQMATGVLKIPADSRVTFTPASLLVKYPSYFRRFRKGDITEIRLNLQPHMDDMIHALVNIPGWEQLKDISIVQKSAIDAQSLGIISRCTKLEGLRCSMKSISAEELARFPFMKTLCHTRFQDYTSTDTIINALSGNQRMWGLEFNNCAISKKGLAAIASLPGLVDLSVADIFHSADEIEGLANAPRLKTIDLGHTMRIDGRLAQVLRSIKRLKKVFIDVSPQTANRAVQEELKRLVPGVQIEFGSTDSWSYQGD